MSRVMEALKEFVDSRIVAYHDESQEELKTHVRDVLEAEGVVVYDPETDELVEYTHDTEGE